MLPTALGLLLAGAQVGIHLDRYAGIPLEEATRLIDAFAREVERSLGTRPVLDDPLWPVCQSADRCVADIKDRTKADELIFVSLFGAPTKIRFAAERWPKVEKTEIDLPRSGADLPALLSRAARALFPDAELPKPASNASAASAAAASVPNDAHGTTLERHSGSLFAFGGGAALLVAGVVFGVVSQRARTRIETVYLSDADYQATLDRMRATGLTADILFAATAACAGLGLYLFFNEPPR